MSSLADKPILDICDVMCPICLNILIDPVVLPCDHCLCSPCFNKNLEFTALACPLCKRRLGSWARKRTRERNLIHEGLNRRIRNQFSVEVEARLLRGSEDDEDDELVEETFVCIPNHVFAEKGEIRKEYELELEKIRRENEEELKRSEELARRLTEEESKTENSRKRKLEEEEWSRSKDLIERLQREDDEEKVSGDSLQPLKKKSSSASEDFIKKWIVSGSETNNLAEFLTEEEQRRLKNDEELARRLQREEEEEIANSSPKPTRSTSKSKQSRQMSLMESFSKRTKV